MQSPHSGGVVIGGGCCGGGCYNVGNNANTNLNPQQQQQTQAQLRGRAPQMFAEIVDGPPEIPRSDLQFSPEGGPIGAGTFGKVFRADCRGTPVAVKITHHRNWSEEALQLLKNEATTMRRIPHPNIVLFLGHVIIDPSQTVWLVTEYVSGGDLKTWIHGNAQKPAVPTLLAHDPRRLNILKLRMVHDIVSGMCWLHSCSILHRDLKPENLLLDGDSKIKVADFGLAEVFNGTGNLDGSIVKGTPFYAAPEVLMRGRITGAADVYSFGLIVHELFYENDNWNKQFHELEPFKEAVVMQGKRPDFTLPPGVPEPPNGIDALITKCWQPNPADRPKFSEILSELEQIMLDYIASDDAVHHFWVSVPAFTRPTLSTEVQVSDLLQHFKEPTEQICRLIKRNAGKDALATGNITLDRFNKLVTWFGPFFSNKESMRQTSALQDQNWFHDDISKDIAIGRLTTMANYQKSHGLPAENLFLVRLSATDPVNAPFSISVYRSDGIVHYRVTRLPKIDINQEDTYSTVLVDKSGDRFFNLVDYVQEMMIKEVLGVPCLRSPPQAGENSEGYVSRSPARHPPSPSIPPSVYQVNNQPPFGSSSSSSSSSSLQSSPLSAPGAPGAAMAIAFSNVINPLPLPNTTNSDTMIGQANSTGNNFTHIPPLKKRPHAQMHDEFEEDQEMPDP